MTDTKIFAVLDVNIDSFKEKFAKLVKRAAKLNIEPPTYTIHGTEERKRRAVGYDEHGNAYLIEPPRWIPYTVVLVSVDGNAPKINGWQFIAAVDYVNTDEGRLPVFRACTATTLPEHFRAALTHNAPCDHCNLDRRRNTIFVVTNGTDYKRVGSNCLADFTGHKSPAELAARAEFAALVLAMGDEDWVGGGRAEGYDSIVEVLNVTATLVRLYGFTSKATANISNVASTASQVQDVLHPWNQVCRDFAKDVLSKSNEADEAKAEAARQWAYDLDANVDNDYLYNLRVVAHTDTVNRKTMGLAASMISAYDRHLSKLAERAVKATSVHIGTVGKRETFTLTLMREHTYATDFGTTFVEVFNDAAGNEVTWKASNPPSLTIGQTYEVTASVKQHGEYKGTKITYITRAKIG